MADMDLFRKEYLSFKSTFKETSYDSDNSVYLCSDETQEVIGFDKIIENMYPDSNNRPKSFDAIYFYDDNIYCIEFKNQKKPDKKDIEEKLLDGKKELIKLMNTLHIPSKKYKFVFCLVYNKHIPKEERFKRGLYKSISFEFLNKYKQEGFVKDIFTENVNFYTKQFKKLTTKELAC